MISLHVANLLNTTFPTVKPNYRTFSFLLFHKLMTLVCCRWNSKQCRPWSDCSHGSSLIWVCTVCSELSVPIIRICLVMLMICSCVYSKHIWEMPFGQSVPIIRICMVMLMICSCMYSKHMRDVPWPSGPIFRICMVMLMICSCVYSKHYERCPLASLAQYLEFVW